MSGAMEDIVRLYSVYKYIVIGRVMSGTYSDVCRRTLSVAKPHSDKRPAPLPYRDYLLLSGNL